MSILYLCPQCQRKLYVLNGVVQGGWSEEAPDATVDDVSERHCNECNQDTLLHTLRANQTP